MSIQVTRGIDCGQIDMSAVADEHLEHTFFSSFFFNVQYLEYEKT